MGPSLHSKHLLEQVTSALLDCVSALQFATDPATLLIPVLGPRVITTVLTGTLNHPHAFVWAASSLTAEGPLQTGSFTNTENMFACPCSFGICRMGSTQWTWLNEWKGGETYLLQGKKAVRILFLLDWALCPRHQERGIPGRPCLDSGRKLPAPCWGPGGAKVLWAELIDRDSGKRPPSRSHNTLLIREKWPSAPCRRKVWPLEIWASHLLRLQTPGNLDVSLDFPLAAPVLAISTAQLTKNS